jgi:hypothetical protein
MTADEIIGERGQSIVLAIGPAVLDRRILALNIAGFAQAPTESGYAASECCQENAPPSSVIKSRRFIRSPRRRVQGLFREW